MKKLSFRFPWNLHLYLLGIGCYDWTVSIQRGSSSYYLKMSTGHEPADKNCSWHVRCWYADLWCVENNLDHQSGKQVRNWWDDQEASAFIEEEIPKDVLYVRSFSTECINWPCTKKVMSLKLTHFISETTVWVYMKHGTGVLTDSCYIN